MAGDTDLGSCRHQPRPAVTPGSPQEPEEARKCSFLEPAERGPADALTLDFWRPTL